MMRYFFLLIVFLLSLWLFLKGNSRISNDEIPIFLKVDAINFAHATEIEIKFKSFFKPTLAELEILKKDYSAIWAHLNHLYATNDVLAGKEYYTEAWFKHICLMYNGPEKHNLIRKDLRHEVVINNWASDGLVCTLTDSVKVAYYLPNSNPQIYKIPVSMVVLFQGDHWRIDAIKVSKKRIIDS